MGSANDTGDVYLTMLEYTKRRVCQGYAPSTRVVRTHHLPGELERSVLTSVVDEPHRAKGHGTELIEFVEKWAKERDCEHVALASPLIGSIGRPDLRSLFSIRSMRSA